MTIAFIHSFRSFLPEIKAYSDFFSNYGIQTREFHQYEYDDIKADVDWHFMGIERRKKKGIITIHEYASASVPPASRIKDYLKTYINAKPDFRIFNNEFVQHQFNFKDGIPSGIRDYGITIPGIGTVERKEFDFVYVGSVDRRRGIERLFNKFLSPDLKEKSLLVLSRDYDHLAKKYSRNSNIVFKGPVETAEAYRFIRKSHFGINYMPDLIPYNHQTSAKLLDYAACGIPIVTTDYFWIREFQKNRGGKYFFLDKKFNQFNWKEISGFKYQNPVLDGLDWNSRIRESGILEFLQSKFTGLQF